MLAAVLVVLIAVASGLALDRFAFLLPNGPGHGQASTWDPVEDWRSAPNQENPSRDRYGNPGVWSYLQSTSSGHNPSSYLLLPNFEGIDAWKQQGMDGTSPDLHQAWTEPSVINAFVGLATPDGEPQSMYLHPAVLAILAWTSPVDGGITISGVVARPQYPCPDAHGGLLFSIERGATTLRAISLASGQRSAFNLTTSVSIGETMYLIVDSDGDAVCDLTSLQLRITFE